MGVATDVDGLTTLVRTVDDAATQLADLDAVNRQAADDVVRAVEAPRRTGRLADTVTAVVDETGFSLTAGSPAVQYAAIVHARNPFLTRALARREDDVIAAYEDHVTDTVNTIKGA